MRTVIEGIEAMEREENACWLGMAMHRRYPGRVRVALRMHLTERKARWGAGNPIGKSVSDVAEI